MRKLNKQNKVALRAFNFHIGQAVEHRDCDPLLMANVAKADAIADLMINFAFVNGTYNKYLPLWQKCRDLAFSKKYPQKKNERAFQC